MGKCYHPLSTSIKPGIMPAALHLVPHLNQPRSSVTTNVKMSKLGSESLCDLSKATEISNHTHT